MAKLKQYDRGYLDGQLDAAENELWTLYRILEETKDDLTKDYTIHVRIKDTEEYLIQHGRSINRE